MYYHNELVRDTFFLLDNLLEILFFLLDNLFEILIAYKKMNDVLMIPLKSLTLILYHVLLLL